MTSRWLPQSAMSLSIFPQGGSVRWTIGLLGDAQKAALLTGVVLLVLLVGAGTGIKARSAQGLVVAAYVVFGLVGVIAAIRAGFSHHRFGRGEFRQ
ncbi:MAG: hypothetical protein CM1200mP26_24060 [Acidimicrobiales bacterium]|nr:MAG: hypothetical protein CM1200mP26_24060 [Acidimicrobiales bacterium]